jgi:hypothetical protein
MSKILDRNLLERVATRNGFDPESLLQVIQRFEVLNPRLRKQAILRAIQTKNWGQLEAFICLGSWVSLGAVKTLPQPLAAIPEVVGIWKSESLEWLLAEARNGRDCLKKISKELRSPEVKEEWLPHWKRAWRDWVTGEIGRGRDTLHRLPESLRGDLEIQFERMVLWCDRCIKFSVIGLQIIPEDMRENPELYAALKTAVLQQFKSGTEWTKLGLETLANLDSRLKTDVLVLQSRRSAWLKYLTLGHAGGVATPDHDLLQDAEVSSAYVRAWKKSLELNFELKIPPELANHSSILDGRRAGVFKWIQTKHPTIARFQKLNLAFLRTDDLVRQAWEDDFITCCKGQPLADCKGLVEEWRLGQKYFGTSADPLTRLWGAIAEKVAQDMSVVPVDSNKDPACLRSWLDGWLLYIDVADKNAVRTPSWMPQLLREHKRVQEVIMLSWLRFVNCLNTRALDRFEEVSGVLAQHPNFREIKNGLWNQAVLLGERTLSALLEHSSPSPELVQKFEEWSQIPIERRSRPDFKTAWKRLFTLSNCHRVALDHLLLYPACDRNLVSLWRNSTDTRKQDVPKALLALRGRPWTIEDLSKESLAHPLIREAAEEGMLELIKKNASYEEVMPESLAQTNRMRSFFEIRNTEAARKQMEEAAGKQIEESAGKQTAEGTEANTSGKSELSRWEREIRKDGVKYAVMPIRLRGEPRLLAALRESVGPLVRKNPGIWTQLPAIIREDECLQRVFRIATRGPLAGLEVKSAA